MHNSSYAASQLLSLPFLVICLSDCREDNWPIAKLETFCFEIIIVWARQFPKIRVILRDPSLWIYIFPGVCWQEKTSNFYIGDSKFTFPTLPAAFFLCPTDVMVTWGNPKCPGEAVEGGGGDTVRIKWGHQKLQKHSQIRAVFKKNPRCTKNHQNPHQRKAQSCSIFSFLPPRPAVREDSLWSMGSLSITTGSVCQEAVPNTKFDSGIRKNDFAQYCTCAETLFLCRVKSLDWEKNCIELDFFSRGIHGTVFNHVNLTKVWTFFPATSPATQHYLFPRMLVLPSFKIHCCPQPPLLVPVFLPSVDSGVFSYDYTGGNQNTH